MGQTTNRWSYKKLAYLLIVLLINSLLIGCDSISGPSPNNVLNKFLDASLKGRYEEAYSYISAKDTAVKTLDEYLRDTPAMSGPYLEVVKNKTSYKIVSLDKSNSHALAVVEITSPDLRSALSDIMGTAFKSAFSDEEIDMEKLLSEKLVNTEIPLITEEKTFKLIQEEGNWKVFLNWKAEKIEKERLNKIQTLLSEAEDLKTSNKLHGALEKYEQILELDSEMVEAKKGVEDTTKEIEVFKEKQKYINSVKLYDFTAKYYDTYLDKKVAGVEFKIKNAGNKTLKEVEVTVYFRDKSGLIIAEEDYYPVLVNEYTFDKKPLKANYIWQMENGMFYKADSVPSEWQEGAASAKITDIEFQE